VASASGTVPYTIPSGTPSGTQLLVVDAIPLVSDCAFISTCGVGAILSLVVNPSPSALNYELGAGSGLTVGWLILLILIVIVVIVMFLLLRRRPRATMMMTPTGASGGAPPPATSAPPEWHEPEPSPSPMEPPSEPPSGGVGSEAPPMPTPPSSGDGPQESS
jgi:hypothetical protein